MFTPWLLFSTDRKRTLPEEFRAPFRAKSVELAGVGAGDIRRYIVGLSQDKLKIRQRVSGGWRAAEREAESQGRLRSLNQDGSRHGFRRGDK